MKRKLRILIIEDSTDDEELLRLRLNEAGYDYSFLRVETAEDMARALEETPDWDLVLSDYSLPTFSAPLALTVLKKSKLDIPLIIISGTIGEERAVSTMREGARDFILKSDLTRLIPVIERELREADTRKLKRKVEQAYKDSEHRYRQIVSAAREGIWLIDREGITTFVNRAMADLLGLHEQKVIGRPVDEFVEQINLPEAPDFFTLIKSAPSGQYDVKFKRRGGMGFWAIASVTTTSDVDQGFHSALCMVTDVTERKVVEQNATFLARASGVLSASLDYKTTLQTLADLVVSGPADWCRVDLALEGALPNSVAVAHPDPEKRQLAMQLQKEFPTDWEAEGGVGSVIRTGKSHFYPFIADEMLAKMSRGPRHLELLRAVGMKSAIIVPLISRGKPLGAISLITADSGRHYTVADLELAEELGRRAGQAVDNAVLYDQSQRAIQIRDEFLSIASHELKTPITTLKLQVQIRKRRLKKGDSSFLEPNQFGGLLDDDEKQINRLTHLIEDMLDISRLHSGKFVMQKQETDLCALALETVERFRPQMEAAGCEVVFDSCGNVIGSWDRYRLEQVLVNLLTNAMKYGAGKPVRITISKGPESARLVVQDHGIGIAKENQERIFQQFERAVSAHEVSGLGLGLYIVKQILDSHHGRITVDSEIGRGSAFTVELPY